MPIPQDYHVSPAPPSVSTKSPGDVLDYLMDFTSALTSAAGQAGDVISSISSLTVSPTGSLVVASAAVAVSGTGVLFWAASGTVGQVYSVSGIVVTTGGRTLQRYGLLPVGIT